MLGILLGILKIIGIVLLVLLGILLTVILLVLFVPLRYRIRGSYRDAPRGMAEVSWLLHILSCRVTYEKELEMAVRVFGIRVGGLRGSEDPEPDSAAVSEPDRSPEPDSESVPARELKPKQEIESKQDTKQKPELDPKQETKAVTDKPFPEAAKQPSGRPKQTVPPRQPRSLWERFRPGEIWEKIRVTFRGICGKLKLLRNKRQEVLEFLRKEENQKTFRNLKTQLFALLKHILPRKLRGYVRLGFDDPATTGQVLTYISPFYGLYGKHFQVIPVFEEKILEGEADMKGRIRVFTLVVIAVKVVMDKNFRMLLKRWRAV